MALAPHLRTYNEALALAKAGRYAEAETRFDQVRTQLGMDANFLVNLGTLYRLTGRSGLAIRSYRQAMAVQPDHPQALVNLANLLTTTGEHREALRYLQMARRKSPQDPTILANLSHCFATLHEPELAWQAIEDAGRAAPRDLAIARRRLTLAFSFKKPAEFEATAQGVLAATRGQTELLVPCLYGMFLADFSRWEDLRRLHAEIGQTIAQAAATGGRIAVSPMVLSFALDDPTAVRLALRDTAADHAALPTGPRPKTTWPPPGDGAANNRPITIGYLSVDFHRHAVAHMLLPILRQHDRARFRLITLGTKPPKPEALSEAIAQAADGHLDLSSLSDAEAVAAIRAAGIDVLVDAVGATEGHRPGLLSLRPAPVQVLWLGCPASTGASWYDAFLVDPVAAGPEFRATCTEPLIDLPVCYHPICSGLGAPAATMNRVTAGLPEGEFVLGLLQLPTKVRPPFIDDVLEILRQAPQVKLWLRVKPPARDQALAAIAAAGIDPGRILFFPQNLGRDDYLACHTLPDLLIDSFPYGGHSTTGEALSLGTPVVTRTGLGMHTRVAASMLHQLGLDDLVTDHREAFIAKVVGLCQDPAALAEVRARTRAAAERERAAGCGPLTRHLEKTYTELLAAAPR